MQVWVREWAEGSGDMGKGDKHALELGRLEAQQEVNTQGNSGTILRMRGEGASCIGPPSSRFGASKKGQALALDQCIRGLWLPISLGKESTELSHGRLLYPSCLHWYPQQWGWSQGTQPMSQCSCRLSTYVRGWGTPSIPERSEHAVQKVPLWHGSGQGARKWSGQEAGSITTQNWVIATSCLALVHSLLVLLENNLPSACWHHAAMEGITQFTHLQIATFLDALTPHCALQHAAA